MPESSFIGFCRSISTNNFFSNVVSDLKIPNHCNLFFTTNPPPPTHTHTHTHTHTPTHTHTHILSLSLSTIIETLENTPIFLILKKETWFSFFIQKDYSRGDIESYPGFKHKKVFIRVTLPPKWSNSDISSNLIYKYFNHWIQKGKFPSNLNTLILFQYMRKIANVIKKTIDM